MADDIWNALYDAASEAYDEEGQRIEPEISRLGGPIAIDGVVIKVLIMRVELSLDPWHVEIIYGQNPYQHSDRPKSCLLQRFWDDKEAWEAVKTRIYEVGISNI